MSTSLKKVIFALAATMILVIASAASANATGVSVTYAGYERGQANFENVGEHLYVDDFYGDGYGMRSYYSSSSTGSAICTNTSGAGTTMDCNLSMPEGQKITFNACVKNGSVNLKCSGYVNDYA